MRCPRRYRIGRLDLGIGYRLPIIDQRNQRVEILARVDRKVRSALDDAGEFGTEPAHGRVRLVNDGLQVVVRYRLQSRVGGTEQGIDVGRYGGVGQRNHVAVLERWRGAVAGQQLDVRFADRRLTVHLGFEVSRDVDAGFQRQHSFDAAIGQVHRLHPANFGAAIGDVAGLIQPAGLRQFHPHRVPADAEQHGRQFHEVQRHHCQRDKRDHGKDH